MKTSKAKTLKAEPEVFERLVGGDGDEFTIVCHPVKAGEPGKDAEGAPGGELACRAIEVKDRPKS